MPSWSLRGLGLALGHSAVRGERAPLEERRWAEGAEGVEQGCAGRMFFAGRSRVCFVFCRELVFTLLILVLRF